MRKKTGIMMILLTCSMLLAACSDEFPVISDSDMNQVGEYAARLLMKYDANHRSRLVSMEEVEARELRDQKRREAAAAREETGSGQEMDPVDEVPVIDRTQGTDGNDTVTNTYQSMADYWGLTDGVSVIYSGFDVTDYLASDFFTMEASEGKSLVLLQFRIENQSGADQTVDILAQSTTFKATFNGDYRRTALTTMLMEDLSTYRGTVPQGTGENVILVFEADREVASDITSISLNLKNESKSYTIQLL